MTLALHRTTETNAKKIKEEGFRCAVYPSEKSPYYNKCGTFFDPISIIDKVIEDGKERLQLIKDEYTRALREEEENKTDPRIQKLISIRKARGEYIIPEYKRSDRFKEEIENGMSFVLADIDESKALVGDGILEGTGELYKSKVVTLKDFNSKKLSKSYEFPEIFYENNVPKQNVLKILSVSELENVVHRCDSDEKCIKKLITR